ncbi:MAG: chromosome segregation protein SMC [Clostridia bacterium]|nr:chromosome segregation protein SMC [Clostridia bacterium]
MNFVKIELIGFKSFADKQEIQFNEGVTAIVGPNGCGKSNIADAIRWVLGEQSAKTLRGSSMQDVIFNGTQNRKSLSYCEVSLYFDNTQKIFPHLEYSEVCMTRKLFRSGESEYYINKQPCRMRDIIFHLHECGVSKNGYSIIGQGKIAEIMNAKPEARRAIFEEAVGIATTKEKKIDNERKLEKTRENIIRIIDISSELEKDLIPMEAKAEKTREYLQLASEFKYHEINNYLYKSDNSHTEKARINTRITGLEEEHAVKTKSYEKAQQDYNDHQRESIEADRKTSALSEEILNLSVGLEKQSGFTSLFNQEINYLQDDNTRLKNEIRESQERISLIDKAISAKTQSIADAESDLDKINKRINEVTSELTSVMAKLSAGESATQDAQNKVLQSVESLADIKMNIGTLSGEKSVISSQQQEVLEKMSQLAEKRNNLLVEKQICETSIERTLKEISDLKVAIEDEEGAIRSTNEYISQINSRIYLLNADLSSLTARKNVYSGLKESFSGYPDSVKNLMLAAKSNAAIGAKVKGLVASVIKTDSKYETAVETLLGGAMSNIITDTPDDAQYLIEHLKRVGGGRVTFLPISSMKERPDNGDLLRAVNEKGALCTATSAVKFDKYFDRVVRHLLGNTLVCDTVENAVAIAKKYRFSFRIVTLDGDLLNANGSMTGGSKRSNTSNLLATDRMLEQIEKDLREKTIELKTLNENKQKSTDQVNEMITDLEAKENSLNENRQNLATLKEKLASYEKSLSEVNLEIKQNEGAVQIINAR